MSIDPQRHLAQLHALSAPPVEGECRGCGRRSRDKTGTCSTCRRMGAAPDLSRYTVEQLGALVKAARAELAHRAAAITAALEQP